MGVSAMSEKCDCEKMHHGQAWKNSEQPQQRLDDFRQVKEQKWQVQVSLEVCIYMKHSYLGDMVYFLSNYGFAWHYYFNEKVWKIFQEDVWMKKK